MVDPANFNPKDEEQASQEKEKPPQISEFRQLIGEVYGTKVCEEQKQNIEDAMLELLEDFRQKELYCMHNDVDDLNSKLLSINLKSQHLDKEKQEVKNIVEQPTKHRTRSLQNFRVILKMSSISSTSQISSIIAIAPDLPTKKPEYSLSMGDEHLSTISETRSEEVIKSSVENLVPIPSESKVTSDNEKFSGELSHIDPIPPGNKEVDFDLEEEIRLVENLFDSQMEEIDLILDMGDLMPPVIESDDYDLEGDIHFLEELLSNDSFPLPENESSNFDHHDDPSFPRPPSEPPNVEVFFDFEPDSRELIWGGEIDVFANVEEDDYFPFIFFIRIFLPYLTYPEVSPLLLSTGSEGTILTLESPLRAGGISSG
nr:hypothetical protein [Tanacetum cinerariifolium]